MYGQPQVAAATQTAPAPAPQTAPATTQTASSAPNTAPVTQPSGAQETESTPAAATVEDTAAPADNKPQPVTTNPTAAAEPETAAITKLQSLTGGQLPWIAFAVGLFSGAALLFLSIKHSLAFKRTLIHGEQFILRHPMFDITLTAVIMVGYVLSHTTGFIR